MSKRRASSDALWGGALALALLVPPAAALSYFVWLADTLGPQLYTLSRLFLLLWPIFAVAFLLRLPWPDPRIRRRDFQALPLGGALGMAMAAAIWLAMLTPLQGVLSGATPVIRERAVAFGILEHYWYWAVLFSVLHAALEEYYWRWFVYGKLLRPRLRPFSAHTVAAVGFAAHHVVIATVFLSLASGLMAGLVVAAAGLAWSLLYQRQGSLAGAWFSHFMVDMALAWVGYRLLFGS